MKRSSKLVFALVATVALLTLTSCNRGVGCPTNFSLGDLAGFTISLF